MSEYKYLGDLWRKLKKANRYMETGEAYYPTWVKDRRKQAQKLYKEKGESEKKNN